MNLNKLELSKILDTTHANESFILDTEDICIDTRALTKGSVFFAIKGTNFDGNSFVQSAIDQGASAVICDEKAAPTTSAVDVITYKNDRKALYDIANLTLSKSPSKRFCITGSNGKTSTKEILATLLSFDHKVHKTLGNFNNDIGLPLTIFKLNPSFDASCVEVGMNALGEIDYLSSLVKPQISIITNIGRAHLEFLKNMKNIAKAKCELIPHTTDHIIINGDHDLLVNEAKLHRKNFYMFSSVGESDIYIKEMKQTTPESSTFVLKDNIHNEEAEIHLPIPGKFNIENYLASYLAARLSGMSKDHIVKATKNLKPTKGRYDPIEVNGIHIINDGYNANPDSMEAGIVNFAEIKAQKKVAILGDMCELGENEKELHKGVGKTLAGLNIDELITFGELGKEIETGAKQSGFTKTRSFTDFSELMDYIRTHIKQNDYLYIKASNATKLYKVAEELQTEE